MVVWVINVVVGEQDCFALVEASRCPLLGIAWRLCHVALLYVTAQRVHIIDSLGHLGGWNA